MAFSGMKQLFALDAHIDVEDVTEFFSINTHMAKLVYCDDALVDQVKIAAQKAQSKA